MMSHKRYKDKVIVMCGLVALIKQKQITVDDLAFTYESLQKMRHRGPDDQDIYYNSHAILGFNRLSIIDLKQGSQPFHNDDFSCHLLFNGEIYNYQELRGQLEKLGFSFTTHCEAEVILALYDLLGKDFITQLRGMFSLVLYDELKGELLAVRDRFGIKPLYYYEQDGVLFLTSELKPFKRQITPESSLDFVALQHYFTFQYIPEPLTCLKDVHTLEPGTYLTYQVHKGITIQTYNTIQLIPHNQISSLHKEQLESVIKESVRAHLQSDVEVGCFLSGGVDSSIITACASKYHPSIKAFTIGFHEAGYSEIEAATKTAESLKIPLYTRYIKSDEFMNATKKVIETLDSPIADPSVTAIYLVAQEARKHVKVILSGEGADELFGGYRIYREPKSLEIFNYLSPLCKKSLLTLSQFIPSGVKGKSFIERGCTPLKDRYVGNAFVFNEAEKERLLNFYDHQFTFKDITAPIFEENKHLDPVSQMQMIDLKTWLRGDILVKSDRLSMAHALELRVPFLDQKVFQLARQLTTSEKIGPSQTKVLLREAFKEMLPSHVFEAHKKGYPVPLKIWLKDELYDQAKTLILSPSCVHLIDQKVALNYLDQHALGFQNHARKIWTLMTFVMWYESFNIE